MPRTYPPRQFSERLQVVLSPEDKATLAQLAEADAQASGMPANLNATMRRLIREERKRRDEAAS
jgi:hypothetical protein